MHIQPSKKLIQIVKIAMLAILFNFALAVSTYAVEATSSTTPSTGVRESNFVLFDSSESAGRITIGRLILNNPAPAPSINVGNVELFGSSGRTTAIQAPRTTTDVTVRGSEVGTVVTPPGTGNMIRVEATCVNGVCIIDNKPQPRLLLGGQAAAQQVPPPAPVIESLPQVNPVVVPPALPSPVVEQVNEPLVQADPVVVPPPPSAEIIQKILPVITPVSAAPAPVFEEKKQDPIPPTPAPSVVKPAPSSLSRKLKASVKANAPQKIQPQVVQPIQPIAPIFRDEVKNVEVQEKIVQEVKQPVITRRPANVFKRTGLFFRRLFFKNRQ